MMSVIAIESATNKVFVFSKGAPEKIGKIVVNSPDSFEQSLSRLALSGYRVIAFAYREIDLQDVERERSVLERELTFLGLVALENKLKDDT